MSAFFPAHLSDTGIGAALLVLAAVLVVASWYAWLIHNAERSEPRTNLPGSLGRDDTWPVLDEWDEHCRTTPGLVWPDALVDEALSWEPTDLQMAAFEADVRGVS